MRTPASLCRALALLLCAGSALALAEDDDAAAVARVSVEEGVVSLVLPAAAQQRLALELMPAPAASAPATAGATARVVDIAALLALRQDFQRSGLEQAAARRRAETAAAQAARLDGLRAIGAVVTAEQQQAVDAAREAARADGELAASRATAASQSLDYAWGPLLAEAARAGTSDLLSALVAHRAHLLLVSPPSDAPWPATAREAAYHAGPAADRFTARLLGAAPVAAGGSGGWWAVTENAGLRTGMLLELQLTDGPVQNGARVPARALVWHGGQQWFYLRTDRERFERRAANPWRLDGGDVLVTELKPGSEVVVRGAQSLLGEELRWSIPAEGDD